jgi:rod shape-determining protein MreC
MARFTHSRVADATASSGHFGARVIIAGLLISGMILLILARGDHPFIQQMRVKTMAVFAPVIQTINAPVQTARFIVSDWKALLSAHTINAQLQAENNRLRHWQSVAVTLARENRALRDLTRYKPVSKTAYISAKVVGGAQNAFSQNLWLNIGAQDGIKPYQPVIDAHGLLGRTVLVSAHAAKLQLLSDPNSRIPVVVGANGVRAVITGAQNGGLKLLFLPLIHNIKMGDMVTSSDDGGLMPPAVAIGRVEAINDRIISVAPIRPITAPDYVRVIQYSAPHAGMITAQ